MNLNQLFELPYDGRKVVFMGHEIEIFHLKCQKNFRGLTFLIGTDTLVSFAEESKLINNEGVLNYIVSVDDLDPVHLPAINEIVEFVIQRKPEWFFVTDRHLEFGHTLKEGRVDLYKRELGCDFCQSPARYTEEGDGFGSRVFCGLSCQKSFYLKK